MTQSSVLIVDDRETDRYLLKRGLKAVNYNGHIFESSNGKAALEFLKDYENMHAEYGDDFPPTAIFLDINMPIMGGFEFLEAFHRLQQEDDHVSQYKTVILIMFSSSRRHDEIEKAYSFPPVKHYLVKGEYSLDELKDAIASLL